MMKPNWNGMRNIRTRPQVLEQIFSGELSPEHRRGPCAESGDAEARFRPRAERLPNERTETNER